MRNSSLALLIALALSASPASAQPETDPDALKELNRKSRDSVVLLKVFGPGGREIGTGTGFFVTGNRLLTNWHVIERASRVLAILASGMELPVVGMVNGDEDNDLAVLEIDGGPFPYLALADSARVEAGERIVVLGNPLGLSGSLSEGIVSAVRPEGLADEIPDAPKVPLLQITAAISPGSSGSPVMNHDGQVIGVAVSQIVQGQSLNFAVPSSVAAGLLDQSAERPVRRKFGARTLFTSGAFLRNLIVSFVLFVALYLTFKYWT